MNFSYTNVFRFFFALVDLLMVNLIYLTLMLLVSKNERAYTLLIIVSNVVWLASAYATGLYINDKLFNHEKFAKRTVQAFIVFVILMLVAIVFFHISYGHYYLPVTLAVFGGSLLFSRILFMLVDERTKKSTRHNKKIIVLGYNDVSKQLVSHFASANKGITVEGYFEDYENVSELTFFPVLGMRNECVPYAIDNNVTEIYSTLSPEKHSYVYEMAQAAERNMIRFKFVPDFRMFVNRDIHVDIIDSIPILSLRSEPLEDKVASTKKRLFDIVFSLFVIVLLLSWLVPILAIMIKLSSKGPIFFSQLRSGKNNKPFKCFKFRTLRVNDDSDVKQVTRHDDRITRVGQFLRKTSLDELPQFFNVLLGTMSVVGPRPHMLKHTEDYSRLLDEYMIRHYVKPGVTGWAQVNGFRGEIKEPEQLRKRIEHDIWYLTNWSLWLDLKIILLTVYVTVKGDENAF
jgi:putative colanic acid biosysnthesis UDP-glucose lipid carrier transferase